ncbi:MAG: GAF domain-containing protein [Firmicutes bacterium]|nr:GAF domain-containing protein [Bacillota bacterium]
MHIADEINIISRLCRIGQEFSSSTDLDELLAKISRCSSEVCLSESASIILLDEEAGEMYFKEVSGGMGEIIKKIRIPLNENSIAGWCILKREAQIINDVANDPRHYKKVDEASKVKTRTLLAIPIIWGDKVFGCIEAINKKDGKLFTEKDQEYLTVLAHQAAVALNNVYLMGNLRNFFNYSVEILIAALEALEPFAKGHIIRVARLAVTLAREMGYSGAELENIWYAAYFHDVGKLARESIYMSHQDLEKVHPALGASLIENIKILEKAAPLVRHHHERTDGSGFPDGLKGESIPEGAQIIGISEEYDEMWWAIRDNMNRQEFNKEFLEHVKDRFQQAIIEAFRGIVEKYHNPDYVSR